ncbi:putative membrane-anchored protein [Friedmanniella endophytica]|uniref:Putative membrane-anchored protein n=1 Tax=Microlunatus kandeliicorticis TaxID=1759536 RepID=A0A7W3P4K9_9ACTN|nr:hypothetical protein [Microlunatus kandeliicorticis]MBA8792942.1 putative membrane-anchored protein [Microlunatus kandeliicorticis]
MITNDTLPRPRPSGVRALLVRPLAVKVPAVTAVFWLVKVLTTGMGEAASDYLGSVSLVLGGAVGVLGLALALGLQLRARSFHPARYWFAVAMVAVFGTMAADVLHAIVGVPYLWSSLFWAAAVAALFLVWRRVEGTVSIHSITTTRRELFYWCTVLATFALGTAAGDLTAIALGWGFLTSAVVFGLALLVPLLAWRLGASPLVTFWTAYVLTRPFGASVADWLGKPVAAGGLGWGDGPVALGGCLAIAALVALLARRVPTPEVAVRG